jgi:hypothetical protein
MIHEMESGDQTAQWQAQQRGSWWFYEYFSFNVALFFPFLSDKDLIDMFSFLERFLTRPQ